MCVCVCMCVYVCVCVSECLLCMRLSIARIFQQKTSRTSATLSPLPPSSSPSPSSLTFRTTSSPQSSHTTRPQSKSSVSSNEGVTAPPSSTHLDTPTITGRQDTPTNDSPFDEEGGAAGGVVNNPSMDVVHSHIKSITQCIQELLQAAQAHRQSRYIYCSP